MLFGSLGCYHKKMYKAVVEMPSGTRHKYEVDKTSGMLFLDRVISVPVPMNYGYIKDTLSEDGDPTDVFIASLEPIPPLTIVSIEVVKLIKCQDQDTQDDKALAYIKNDKKTKTVLDIDTFEKLATDYLKRYKEGMRVQAILEFEEATKVLQKNEDLFFSQKA